MIIDDYEPIIPDDWWEKRLGGSIEERTIARLKAENENLRKAAEFEHNQLEDIKRAADMMLEEHNAMLVENAKLRELFEKTYGYYVSGTLTPCDFCKRLDCEGNAPTTCEADEYDPDGIVNNEIERLMRELGIKEEL